MDIYAQNIDRLHALCSLMLPKTSVSIIIPTYQRPDFVAVALDALLAQTRPPDEIIVVDDGSTDHTADVLRRYATHVRIRIIRQSNQGRGAARNAGLNAAAGDWIILHDDDDWLPPRSIERRLVWAVQHPTADVIYGETAAMDAAGAITRFTGGNRARPVGNVFAQMALENLVPIHAIMFKRALLAQTGLFDTDRTLIAGEDWDFWLRIAAHASFAYLPDVVAFYRFRSRSYSLRARNRAAHSAYRVAARALTMPAFIALTPLQRARVYRRFAVRAARIGRLAAALHALRRTCIQRRLEKQSRL
jgi:glycosyltransferase involved in cell wall biosynthesis